MTTTATLDVTTLVRAIEERDVATQLSAYAPDASITLVDQDNPPSAPRIMRGTDQLRAHLTDVTGRDMTHEVRTAIATGDQLALEVACAYPDGTDHCESFDSGTGWQADSRHLARHLPVGTPPLCAPPFGDSPLHR